MSPTLTSAPVRKRWRAALAIFTLVGALVATTSTMSASADVVGTGPGTISGTVTTDAGQPLAGVYVTVAFGGSVATDANGHYEFSGLDLHPYDVFVSTPAGYASPPVQNPALTAESPTAIADFVLVPYPVGVGTISGLVTADGVPIAGVSLTAYEFDTGQSAPSVSDENGYYEITGLPNGRWNVYAYAGTEYQTPELGIILITNDAPNVTVDVPFLSWPVGTSTIGGIARDSATGEGIPNINVYISGLDVPQYASATTDETGAFSFELLPAGTYAVQLWGTGYLQFNQDVHVADDESVTLEPSLIAANSTISGHVRGSTGLPVAGIYVDAHAVDGYAVGGATTDENGDYVISNIGAIEYTLSLGGIGTPYKHKERTVAAVPNANVVANFKLKNRTTGYITGVVFGPGEEWYTAPVCVTLYSSKNKSPVAEVRTYGEDFGDGTFGFEKVKPGSYTLEFEDCDADAFKKFDNVFLGGATKYKDATFITIVAAQDSFENNITVVLRAPNSTISGHIAKPNGTPIAGLTVNASGEDSTSSAVTNANGDYAISGLFNGEYTVSAGGTGTLYVHKEKSVTAVEGGSVTVNFSLAKK